MADTTLSCSHCGAPVQYDGSDVSSITCPFCSTTVIIPPELRPARPQVIEVISPPVFTINTAPSMASPVAGRRLGLIIGGIILFTVLCVGVTTLVPLFMAGSLAKSITSQVLGVATDVSKIPTTGAKTKTPVPTPTRASSPTPGYEVPGITFGQKGINPGQFNDARYIATDGTSTIYVAEYSGGRVQAFDMNGKFLYQWKVGTAKTIIEGLAADRQGGVYLSYGADIVHVNGKTGEQISKLSNPKGGEFGDLLITPEGNLAAVWYEGRWGMITSLEGHSEDILFFNPGGKLLKTLTAPVSSQTDDPALDVFIAIDGKGTLYALSQGVIYVYSAAGKYLNMFGSTGSAPGQFSDPGSICTDNQGQVLVGNSSVIDVFSGSGQFVALIKNEGFTSGLAYDDHASLWVLAMDQVTQYQKPGQ